MVLFSPIVRYGSLLGVMAFMGVAFCTDLYAMPDEPQPETLNIVSEVGEPELLRLMEHLQRTRQSVEETHTGTLVLEEAIDDVMDYLHSPSDAGSEDSDLPNYDIMIEDQDRIISLRRYLLDCAASFHYLSRLERQEASWADPQTEERSFQHYRQMLLQGDVDTFERELHHILFHPQATRLTEMLFDYYFETAKFEEAARILEIRKPMVALLGSAHMARNYYLLAQTYRMLRSTRLEALIEEVGSLGDELELTEGPSSRDLLSALISLRPQYAQQVETEFPDVIDGIRSDILFAEMLYRAFEHDEYLFSRPLYDAQRDAIYFLGVKRGGLYLYNSDVRSREPQERIFLGLMSDALRNPSSGETRFTPILRYENKLIMSNECGAIFIYNMASQEVAAFRYDIRDVGRCTGDIDIDGSHVDIRFPIQSMRLAYDLSQAFGAERSIETDCSVQGVGETRGHYWFESLPWRRGSIRQALLDHFSHYSVLEIVPTILYVARGGEPYTFAHRAIESLASHIDLLSV